ncbi:hypothetical protein FJU30_07515 [Affinibrenneria salicis]|uniref:Uncharacterized protein n=1 Tax=Affinibrenneria salicis TaxID=2590031 RepID=A0A5J5G2S2_9GAMM|nr:hypothetical protein [Affinibrenneria salicis]KAA9001096.1 hypothetical protein FJU30_07515 [Affinibrenneria salicis]
MWIDYGIVCALSDEKKIVKNINHFLVQECGFRKMYKWPDRAIRPADKPFEIDHYYSQFLKQEPGWLFDVMPNYDKIGRIRFSQAPECGWTLFTKPFREFNADQDLTETQTFFARLVDAIGFPVRLLHQYRQNEDRI